MCGFSGSDLKDVLWFGWKFSEHTKDSLKVDDPLTNDLVTLEYRVRVMNVDYPD